MKASDAFFLALFLPWCSWADVNPNNPAARDSSKIIETVGHAAEELSKEARDPYASIYHLHRRARDLEDGVVSEDAVSDFQPYELKIDWAPKEWRLPKKYSSKGDIPSMLDALYKGALLGAKAPPDPLVNAYNGAAVMQSQGKVSFDDGELPDNVAGACYYTPGRGANKIRISPWLELCGKVVGDRMCSVIFAHEGDHCYRAARNQLDPKDVKKGEVSAFNTEAIALERITSPYERSVLIANFGPNAHLYNPLAAGIPAFVKDLMAHFGELLEAYEHDDMPAFVEKSGYRNPDRSRSTSG